MENESHAIIVGTIETIVFASPESGFHVLRVRDESTNALQAVTGKSWPLRKGDRIRAVGTLEHNAKFGRQLTAATLETIEATTDDGLATSWVGLVSGLGVQRARRLVTSLGGAERAIYTLDHAIPDPHGTPCPVSWLAQDIWSKLVAVWREQRTARAVDAQLASYDLPPGLRNKLRAAYGGDAARVLRETPYRLVRDIEGVGFLTADDLAIRVGVGKDSDERIEAAVLYVLERLADEDGHTASSTVDICKRLVELFLKRVVPSSFAKDPMGTTGRILDKLETADRVVSEGGFWALPKWIEAELTIAENIERLISADPFIATYIGILEKKYIASLTGEQWNGFISVISQRISILTGGPGVGKTTTCNAIVAWAVEFGLSVALCAPTARAAKRLSEATGREARTIHRLLEPRPNGGSGIEFQRNASNMLDVDVLICDETSMVDIELMAALIQAVPSHARLVFVGDPDQLPPVGPGAPFRDMIVSNKITVTRLTQVHRQAAGSAIISVSHAMMRGKRLEVSAVGDRSNGCLHVVQTESDAVKDRVVAMVCDAKVEFQCDPKSVMVIAPMRKGSAGVLALNRALQMALNPRLDPECEFCKGEGENDASCACQRNQIEYGKDDHQKIFRVGDRVRHTKNDYGRSVVNGDIGAIVWVKEFDESRKSRSAVWLSVEYPGVGVVTYTQNQLIDLQLAYCGTIHSVQGSEASMVIFALVDEHRAMLSRMLVYTAITRAKRACLVVGSSKALARAAANTSDDRRRTWLGRRLAESGKAAAE